MSKRILVADDEAWVRLIVHDSLRKLGDAYEIVTVSNGIEALHWLEQKRFDLVVTDIRMPGMSGVELTRAVGEIQPDAHVIWMTAYGCEKTAMQSMKLRVYRCLDKPIEISEIRRAVHDALEGRMRPPRRVQLPEEGLEYAR